MFSFFRFRLGVVWFLMYCGGVVPALPQQMELPGRSSRFLTSEKRYEFEEAEVALADGRVIYFEPVVCVTKVRIPADRVPDIKTHLVQSFACTRSGKPWLLSYMDLCGTGLEGEKRGVFSKRVLIDLKNRQWIMHTSRWGGEEVIRAVERYIDECPGCPGSWVHNYLSERGLLREFWFWETDQLKVADFDLDVRTDVTGKKVKQWFEKEVLEVLKVRQPELLATLQELADAVARAKDSEGRRCSFTMESFLELLIPGRRFDVVRECESHTARYGKGEKPPWENFWEQFSRWDTWPEFPKMSHFRF